MLAFIIRRVLQSLVVVAVMSLIVFSAVNLVGDPVDMLVKPESGQEEIARVRHDFGLDQPFYVQYLRFVEGALSGNLGKSFIFGRPALLLMAERFPATMELAFTALIIALLVGLPLGIHAGLKPESPLSKLTMGFSVVGLSVPTFWIGVVMILFFAVHLGWLPVSGRGETARFLGIESSLFTLDGIRHLILPAFNLALFKIAMVIRLARAGTREVVALDFMRFARAKGLSRRRIVRVHLLPNILIPIVTVIGVQFGVLIAFSTVTETIFAWPGLGKLVIEFIVNLDRPVIVAYLLFVVVMFMVLNLLVDILYALLDPRVRLTGDAS